MAASTTSQSLIVPIDVAALCVGATDVNGSDSVRYGTRDFARVASDFSDYPYLDMEDGALTVHNAGPNITDLALPQPFMAASRPLEQGIHLHWALPDALSHGVTDAAGGLAFREAPNRWLVVRIASSHEHPASPACSLKGWIIESDHLQEDAAQDDQALSATNASSLDIPLQPDYDSDHLPNKAYRKLGRVFSCELWKEEGEGSYLASTTALGYGIASFAAAYDHCRNVFGLHDTLEDLDLGAFKPDTSRISYLVAGWFADDRRDPLARPEFTGPGSYADKLAALREIYGWTFTADQSGPFPSRVYCSGLLSDIRWDPIHTHYINPRPDTPGDLTVAVGDTTIEALSALIAHDPALSHLPNVERFMNALQLGVLQNLGKPDGAGQFEEILHQSHFGSIEAGRTWTIRRNDAERGGGDPAASAGGARLLDAASALGETLPSDIAVALDKLNAAQGEYDAASFAVDSRRRQIFVDWYKYMIRAYPSDRMEAASGGLSPLPLADDITADDAVQLIQSEMDELAAAVTGLETLKTRVTRSYEALEARLGPGYRLAELAAPRYWQPNDPVLLLSGPDVTPSSRYTDDVGRDARGALICRLSGSILSAMSVDQGAFIARGSDLPRLPAAIDGRHADDLAALLADALFVDENQAWQLAHAIAKQGGNGNPAVADPDGFARRVQRAQRSMRGGEATPEGITFTGIPSTEAGVRSWKSPWVPLLLQWEAYYYPAQPVGGKGHPKDYPVDFITTTYRLDGRDTDLVRRDSAPPDLSTRHEYRGAALLTHNTEINIRAQIDTYLKNYPDDPAAAELKTIRDNLKLSMMAQSMDGFNQALLMRRHTLQLPVFDPLGASAGPLQDQFSNRDVRDAVGARNDSAPVPLGSYNPLRAGSMEIARIRIIDTFGQVREVRNPAVIRAESLVAGADNARGALITLPPRIVQPTRFSFRWLSADDDLMEMNSQPESSPIFGWILFNHLDTSLMIYSAAGDLLGSLNARGDLWRGAPGNDATYAMPPEAALAGANPHLRKFVLGICHNPKGRDFLGELLGAIDRASGMIIPSGQKQDRALSLLIGRPLALVRASIDLELQGLPALDTGWEAFREAVPAAPYAGRNSAGFARVKFPVMLGDPGKTDDGLIGYFIDDGSEEAYRVFHAVAPAATGSGVTAAAADGLQVDAATASPGLTLSMIVDPRAPVHGAVGILPSKRITIPPHMFGDALNRMAVTFLITPLLTGRDAPAIPLPREEGFAWSWITHNPAPPEWVTSGDIADINAQGNFESLPQRISEGWLKLSRVRPPGENADGEPQSHTT